MSDPSSSPSPVSKEVLLIIGPVLVGSFISYMLLGIVIVQVYLYYMSFPNDKLWIKLTVYSLFILDLMHTVALSSSSWSFLCSGWGRPEHLEFTEWGFALIPLFSGACSTIVQMFFVWRIYTLGNLATYSNKLLWTVIVLIISLSLAQFAGSVVATVQWFLISDLARFSEVFGEVAVWLGGGAAADVMITISMFYLLHRVRVTARKHSRQNWHQTDHLLSRLIRNAVETGAITSGGAIAFMIMLFAAEKTSLHASLSFGLAKLYTNTLYASLNARIRLGRDGNGFNDISTIRSTAGVITHYPSLQTAGARDPRGVDAEAVVGESRRDDSEVHFEMGAKIGKECYDPSENVEIPC